MATISKDVALEIVKNKGYYHGDTRAAMVLKYRNSFHGNNESYAVIYEEAELKGYTMNHVTSIIWSRKPRQ